MERVSSSETFYFLQHYTALHPRRLIYFINSLFEICAKTGYNVQKYQLIKESQCDVLLQPPRKPPAVPTGRDVMGLIFMVEGRAQSVIPVIQQESGSAVIRFRISEQFNRTSE
jgi:hypothetical protein